MAMSERDRLLIRGAVQTVVWLAVLAAILCASGGDGGWIQAWIYIGEVGVLSAALSAWLAFNDPALFASRLTSPFKTGQRPFDRRLIIAMGLAFLAWLALCGVDARRWRWTTVPSWVETAGAVLIAGGLALCWLTFRANTFAAPQVRIQTERGQTVISTGPYRYVRHPMYLGAALYIFGTPLLLGSLWGLAGAVLLALGLGLRTLGEEKVLCEGLPGYRDYMRQTRWRILPGIW